jgi:hypothetical protein
MADEQNTKAFTLPIDPSTGLPEVFAEIFAPMRRALGGPSLGAHYLEEAARETRPGSPVHEATEQLQAAIQEAYRAVDEIERLIGQPIGKPTLRVVN